MFIFFFSHFLLAIGIAVGILAVGIAYQINKKKRRTEYFFKWHYSYFMLGF